MKKQLYLFVALVAMIALTACPGPDPEPIVDASSIYLMGICKGETSTGQFGNCTAAAVLVDAATVQSSGTQIIGVRLFVDEGCTGGKAFLASELGGAYLAEKDFTYQKGGWQYVIFDTPYDIPATATDLYIGYECEGEGYYIGAEKKSGKGKFNFVNFQDEWQSLQDLQSTTSCLSIQAICVGGNYSAMTQNKIVVENLECKKNLRAGEVITFTAEVRNAGVKTTGNVTVTATCGSETLTQTVSGLRNGESKIVTFTNSGCGIDMKSIEVKAEMEGAEASTVSEAVNVYAADAPTRNGIFIEEFTSQLCPNCPRAITAIRNAIAGMANPSQGIWVAHHAGYYDDDFTIAGDVTVANKFGINYAPAMMVDRMPIDGTALDFCPGTTIDPSWFDELATIPANASLDMQVSYADSTVTVTCSGSSYKNAAKITIMICQNGLVRTQSQGGDDFVHGEVVRAYLTAPLGDDVTIAADGSYTFTATYQMPATVSGTKNVAIPTDVDNMFVVAAVHGATASDPAVYNSARANLK